MSKSLNRHYTKVHKKKEHPAAKCGNAKCLICHSSKIMKIPNKKMLQMKAIEQETRKDTEWI